MLPHRTPTPPAPLTAELPARLEGEAPRRYHHTTEPAPSPQGHGGGERLRAKGTSPPLFDTGRGGHILPLPRRSPSPQRPVGQRAEGKGGQQLGHRAGPPGWQRDSSTITSSPHPGDGSLYLRCILCEAIIRFRQGSDQRFRDHMRNEHEVSSGHMGFLFAMHFGDPGDRAAWRDAMKPRMDRFRDRAAHERVSSLFRANYNARPSPLPAPATPLNPQSSPPAGQPPSPGHPTNVAAGGEHRGHSEDTRSITERLLGLSGTSRGPIPGGSYEWRTASERRPTHPLRQTTQLQERLCAPDGTST